MNDAAEGAMRGAIGALAMSGLRTLAAAGGVAYGMHLLYGHILSDTHRRPSY